MSDTVEFVLKLRDEATGSLKGIIGSLEQAKGATNGLKSALGAVGTGFAALGGLGLAAGAAAVGLVGAGAKFALDAGVFKENSLVAFKAVLGTADEAKKAYDMAVKFAGDTPLETDQVVNGFKRLAVAGFKVAELPTVMAGLGDIQSLFGTQAMDGATAAMSKVMMTGKLQAEMLESLGLAGVASDKLFENLSKITGLDPKKAQELASSGGIDKRTLVTAILKTVQGDRAFLGQAMKEQSQSMTGLWSSLASRPFELVNAADTSGAFNGIKKFLSDVTKAFDPAGPSGKKITAFITQISDGLGKFLNGALADGSIDKTVNGIIALLENVKTAFSGIAAGFSMTFGGMPDGLNPLKASLADMDKSVSSQKVNWKELGAALGTVANAIIAIVNAGTKLSLMFANDGPVNKLIFKIANGAANDEARADAAARAEAVGRASGAGLVSGLATSQAAANVAGANLGAQAAAGAKAALAVSSPSKVFADIGMNVGLGMEQGLDGGQAGVQSSMQDLLSFAAPSTSLSSMSDNSRSSSSSSVSMPVSVAVSGTGGDAQATGQATAMAVRAHLASVLDELRAEAGAAA